MKAGLAFFGALMGLAGSSGGASAAEVIVLHHGGRIVASSVATDQTQPRQVVVVSADGARLTLDRSLIKETFPVRPEELEYEQVRPRYRDTVEDQWALAEWCRQRSLVPQRETHLRRILEMNSNHEQARRGLGHFFDEGVWTTRDDKMSAMGYVKHKGQWMTVQEIQLLKEEADLGDSQRDWAQKIKQYRDWLADPQRAGAAREALLKVRSPYAVKALAQALKDERGRGFDQARLIYIAALANIGDSPARKVLTLWVMAEPADEVALTCLDYLKKFGDPEAAQFFIAQLRSKDNATVNRAAAALGHLGAPTAIGPLIDALVTQHERIINPGGSPGQINTTFGTGGTPGGGMSVGGGPKKLPELRQNRNVLDALTKLTGQSFGFDESSWKAWFANQRSRTTLDARRSQ